MINWLLNKRIEIVVNPRGYDRGPFLGQTRVGLAPRLYFLWGYDITLDANVLALRVGPETTPQGIAGWRLDFTLARRGPPWKWPRLRYNWRGAAESAGRYVVWLEQRQAERRKAA